MGHPARLLPQVSLSQQPPPLLCFMTKIFSLMCSKLLCRKWIEANYVAVSQHVISITTLAIDCAVHYVASVNCELDINQTFVTLRMKAASLH